MLKNSGISKSFFLIQLQTNLEQVNEIFLLQKLSAIAVKSGILLHEIQRERAHSIWYLGTKGENFTKLNSQRKKTDLKMSEYENYLKSVNLESFNGEIKDAISKTIIQLSTLKREREMINSLTENIDSSIAYFSTLIGFFISLIEMLCKFNINSKLTRGINTYILLLKLKEKIGQERATLTGTFSENKFNINRIASFLEILNEQELYEKKFLNKATKEQMNLYYSKIEDRILNEINDFRKIAIKNLITNTFGVSTKDWLRIITNKIDLLKEVEDKVFCDITNDIEKLRKYFHNQAKQSLFKIANI